MIERTLAIIKPDAVAKGVAGQILARIEQTGFKDVQEPDLGPDVPLRLAVGCR